MLISIFILGYEKAKRPRSEKRFLVCPFAYCLKEFSETGNLKTHLRTHVLSTNAIIILFRLVRGHTTVVMMVVTSNS